MIELNLETQTKEQELIKKYLQENASQTLADKINNGVPYEKDNKQLINKKDLAGFMNYASEEAKKLAEKGASCACIEDKVVYGWAIHYFEEDSIIGTLYNENGEKYEPVIEKPKQTITVAPKVKKQNDAQYSMFSFDEPKVEEIENINGYPVDTSTGEVVTKELSNDEISEHFDSEISLKLCELLDNKLDMN